MKVAPQYLRDLERTTPLPQHLQLSHSLTHSLTHPPAPPTLLNNHPITHFPNYPPLHPPPPLATTPTLSIPSFHPYSTITDHHPSTHPQRVHARQQSAPQVGGSLCAQLVQGNDRLLPPARSHFPEGEHRGGFIREGDDGLQTPSAAVSRSQQNRRMIRKPACMFVWVCFDVCKWMSAFFHRWELRRKKVVDRERERER